jgi:hypothetical protein
LTFTLNEFHEAVASALDLDDNMKDEYYYRNGSDPTSAELDMNQTLRQLGLIDGCNLLLGIRQKGKIKVTISPKFSEEEIEVLILSDQECGAFLCKIATHYGIDRARVAFYKQGAKLQLQDKFSFKSQGIIEGSIIVMEKL